MVYFSLAVTFLTNKKKTAYYLLIMDDQKRLDMNKLKEITGEKESKWLLRKV